MIGVLPNLPPNVAGFRASGQVTREDYEKVVFPEVERHKRDSDELNFVFFVDTAMKNFSLGAWIRDLWLGLKGFTRWNKVAIISDVERIRNFTNAVSPWFPGEYKGFPPDQLEDAVRWAATREKGAPPATTDSIPAYIERFLPAQQRGTATVTSAQVVVASEKDARFVFERAVDRLQDVNQWSEHCGSRTSFQLIDEDGEPLQGSADKEDFIRIDLPGPGGPEGEGYDWVQIEKIGPLRTDGTDTAGGAGSLSFDGLPDEPNLQSVTLFILQVRPSVNPCNKPSTTIAHYLESSATSTFLIERQGTTISASIYGRNEVPHTEKSPAVGDKWRNAVVGSIGAIGLSKGQWKALAEGLLEKE